MEKPAFVVPVGWEERYAVAVWYVLPFCLYVPYDHYEVRLRGLNRGRSALVELDQRTRQPEVPFAMLPADTGEMWRDRRGLFRFSTAVVWMPYIDAPGRDLEKLLEFMPTQRYLEYAMEYLNRFLRVYRAVTADYYIPTLALEDVWNYFGIGVADTGRKPAQIVWTPMGAGQPDVNLLPDKPPGEMTEIRRMLRSDERILEEEELLMSARDLLETGSHRLAVVEAQTAFETAVRRLVADYYRGHGHSTGEIDRKLECGFKSLLRDHLSAKVRPFTEGVPEHDNYWTRAYKPRSALVHGERFEITQSDVEQAIRSIEEALEYLTGRPHDRTWPPERPPLRLM